MNQKITEEQIITLLCRQLTVKEIAYSLNVSIRTVEDRIHKMKQKYDCVNIVGLALFGVKNGIYKI